MTRARDDNRGEPHPAHRRPCLDRDRVPDHVHRTGQRQHDPSRDPGGPSGSGTVRVVSTGEGSSRYTFVPAAPLQPDTRYDFTVSGVRDVGRPHPGAAVDGRSDGDGTGRRRVAPGGGRHRRRDRHAHHHPFHRADGHERNGSSAQRLDRRQANPGHDRLGGVEHCPPVHARQSIAIRDEGRRRDRCHREERHAGPPRVALPRGIPDGDCSGTSGHEPELEPETRGRSDQGSTDANENRIEPARHDPGQDTDRGRWRQLGDRSRPTTSGS